MASLVGAMFGENNRYEILEEQGRGGVAVVYRARDKALDRLVAIKMLLPERPQSERFLRRFEREARVLAQLHHPNIVTIFDFGEYKGTPYLVMDFISGGSLSSLVGKQLPVRDVAALLAPVARALHYAHQHKIIHRDIKPGNVLMNASGQPTLADFGIVKLVETEESQSLTGTGMLVGTPSYMAPEQIQGRTIDGRTDIYALGCMFYEMVTGQKPYPAKTPVEITLRHLNDPAPHAKALARDLPMEVDQVIYKAMAKKPDDRFADMSVFAKVLETIAAGQKVNIKALPKPQRQLKEEVQEQPEGDARPVRKKLPMGVLIGGGLALILLVAMGMTFFGTFRPTASTQVSTAVSAAAVATETTVTPTLTPSLTITLTPSLTPTLTPEPPTATPTLSPTQTEPVATKTLDPTATAGPQSDIITAENFSQVAALGRVDKVPFVRAAWMKNNSRIIVSGSGVITFVNPVAIKADNQIISLASDTPRAMALTDDNQEALLLFSNQVRFYDLEKRKENRKITIPGGANSLAVSPNKQLIALGMLDNKVMLFDYATGANKGTFNSNYGGWSVAFSPDGKLLVSGTSQGVLLWEVNTGNWLPINTGTQEMIQVVAFSADGKYLAGGGENVVYVWEVASGNEVVKYTDVVPFGKVNDLSFSPNTKLLSFAADNKNVYLLNIPTGDQAGILKKHNSQVFCSFFSPDGAFLFTKPPISTHVKRRRSLLART